MRKIDLFPHCSNIIYQFALFNFHDSQEILILWVPYDFVLDYSVYRVFAEKRFCLFSWNGICFLQLI